MAGIPVPAERPAERQELSQTWPSRTSAARRPRAAVLQRLRGAVMVPPLRLAPARPSPTGRCLEVGAQQQQQPHRWAAATTTCSEEGGPGASARITVSTVPCAWRCGDCGPGRCSPSHDTKKALTTAASAGGGASLNSPEAPAWAVGTAGAAVSQLCPPAAAAAPADALPPPAAPPGLTDTWMVCPALSDKSPLLAYKEASSAAAAVACADCVGVVRRAPGGDVTPAPPLPVAAAEGEAESCEAARSLSANFSCRICASTA